jgi:protein-S-isoprenylcysteine O-methyltransferase Ste14
MIMLGLIYGVVSYLAFLGVFAYFALFSGGVGVPQTVDRAMSAHGNTALIIDLALILIFGLQHSIMARPRFKRALTRVVPATVERATFVLASSAVLALLMWQWRALPTVVWDVESPIAAGCLWALNAAGWLTAVAVTFMIDHLELVGVKQALSGFRRATFERKGFVTPLLYKYVRHPMMTAVLVALWATPHMTVGHVLLSAGMSVYIAIGVHFEERALVEELGLAYRRYQATTPKFVPLGAPAAAVREPQETV